LYVKYFHNKINKNIIKYINKENKTLKKQTWKAQQSFKNNK